MAWKKGTAGEGVGHRVLFSGEGADWRLSGGLKPGALIMRDFLPGWVTPGPIRTFKNPAGGESRASAREKEGRRSGSD
ncbi:MAG: hypothetical protein CM15mP74_05130 [Halieaceae bacterium]|nr:MAG: hypothetical protein CM15mP74_05130 [Halieaceae bacterium]